MMYNIISILVIVLCIEHSLAFQPIHSRKLSVHRPNLVGLRSNVNVWTFESIKAKFDETLKNFSLFSSSSDNNGTGVTEYFESLYKQWQKSVFGEEFSSESISSGSVQSRLTNTVEEVDAVVVG